jgi:DNA-binding IclR family transcriptional regulator
MPTQRPLPDADTARATSTSRGRRPTEGEPVLERAFRLLGAFGPGGESLTLSELSEGASLPKSTALRLARKLVELGALERTDGGDYMIGLRLLEFASLAPRGHGLRGLALPHLEDLHRATGQHVLLAVRDGVDAVLLERLSARDAGRVLFRVGGRLPLHSTGVGLALLAHAPTSLLDRVIAGDLRLKPERGTVSAHELRAQLAAVRRDGVAVVSRQMPDPMTSVAAPVTGANGGVVAAISVVAPSETMRASELRPAVMAVARAVSRNVTSNRSGRLGA